MLHGAGQLAVDVHTLSADGPVSRAEYDAAATRARNQPGEPATPRHSPRDTYESGAAAGETALSHQYQLSGPQGQGERRPERQQNPASREDREAGDGWKSRRSGETGTYQEDSMSDVHINARLRRKSEQPPAWDPGVTPPTKHWHGNPTVTCLTCRHYSAHVRGGHRCYLFLGSHNVTMAMDNTEPCEKWSSKP